MAPANKQSEVLHAYAMPRTTIEKALEQHPHSWAITLAQVALAHDENHPATPGESVNDRA